MLGRHFAALENHKRRHGTDLILGRDAGVLINIDLDDLHFAYHFGCHLVEGRRHRLTGPAPFGEKVDDDGLCRLQHDLVECAVRNTRGIRHWAVLHV